MINDAILLTSHQQLAGQQNKSLTAPIRQRERVHLCVISLRSLLAAVSHRSGAAQFGDYNSACFQAFV